MISVGQKLPNLKVKTVENGQIAERQVTDIFKGKKVLFFGVPGAFTPTCSNSHLPSFVKHFDDIKKKGVDYIVCEAVNDAFVLSAWAKATNASEKVLFIADGSAELAKALGLELDATAFGMGVRSHRFSMLVKDEVVQSLHVEKSPGECTVTDAAMLLKEI